MRIIPGSVSTAIMSPSLANSVRCFISTASQVPEYNIRESTTVKKYSRRRLFDLSKDNESESLGERLA